MTFAGVSVGRLKRLLAAVFLAGAGAATAAVATAPESEKLADLRRRFESDGREPRHVAVTGAVNARVGEYLLIHDGSDGVCVRFPPGVEMPNCGEMVGLVCTVPSEENPSVFCADAVSCRRIGPGPATEPEAADIASVLSGRHDYRIVRVSGVVTDVFRDETDPNWVDFVLETSNLSLVLTTYDGNRRTTRELEAFVDRAVEATGVCDPTVGLRRKYRGRILSMNDFGALRVLPPAECRMTDFPHRQSFSGVVVAGWGDEALFLRESDGRRLRVYLSRETARPRAGARVTVAGFCRKDEFFLSVVNAVVLTQDSVVAARESPTDIRARDVLLDDDGRPSIHPEYDGRLIRVEGLVRTASEAGRRAGQVTLDCDGVAIGVVCEGLPVPPDGARIAVVGACRIDTAPRQIGTPWLKLVGFSVVPRTADDIVVLRPPSWWTPRRFQTIVCSLVLLLIVVGVWNRILGRIIARRCRQLVRARLDRDSADLRAEERTRLAVELHDSLSQSLSGVACQVAAAQDAIPLGPEALQRRLMTARRMLDSSRTELKRCLWDLRGPALEEPDFDLAVRETLEPVVSDCQLTVRCEVPRTRLSDRSAHSILCVIRELCSNAIRHGAARNVRVTGEAADGMLVFEVTDDGCGFDPERCPGIAEGHFGLEGIRERVRRLDGRMSIRSAAGEGVSVRIELSQERAKES